MRTMLFLLTLISASAAHALPRADLGAFDEPMKFAGAGTGGNCSKCSWISAIGVIAEATPEDFANFLGVAPVKS